MRDGGIEMIDTKELRRLAQEATPGPWKTLPVGDGRQKFAVADSEFLSILTVTDEGGATFGTVYDDADAKFIAAANPATLSELLDRLEAAEKSDAESIAMYRKARDERDALRAALRHEADCLEAAKAEIEALRAKIAAMEQQEPVAKVESWTNGSYTRHYKLKWLRDVGEGAALYALPGAQGEIDSLRIENEALRAEVIHIKEVEFPRKAQAVADAWRGKCERLEAKIEALERQKPVGKFIRHPSNGLWAQDGYGDNPDARPLYALPGAQGEEK